MLFKRIFAFPNLLIYLSILLIARYLVESYLNDKRYKPKLLIGNAQDRGSRKEQEDSFSTIKNENGVLAVLADGMGGLSLGKKASNLVVRTFLEEFTRTYNIHPIKKFLINTTYISNAKVLEFSTERNIGTTLVAVLINNGRLYWTSVGDSYIYLYREKELNLLNEQHTFAKELAVAYEAGEISQQVALNHPKRDRLTSYLGYENFYELDYSNSAIELQQGDKVILCSDGINDSLSERELEKAISKRAHPLKISEEILKIVLDKNINNQDNATVIVLEKT